MVSLENKISYLKSISKNLKLKAFSDLLCEKKNSIGQDLNEADEIYFGILNSIHSNSKMDFAFYYNKKNKSNPIEGSPSPFVNDDFLIFCLIVGIKKFNFDYIWINKIISIRTRNPITITFENILNDNYLSKSNIPEIIFLYLYLNNNALISNDIMNWTYQNICKNKELFNGKNDFQTIIANRSYDLIIEIKDSLDGNEYNLLKKFNLKFIRRVRFLKWLIEMFISLSVLFALWKLPTYLPETKKWFDDYGYLFTVLGALGITFLTNSIPVFKKVLFGVLLRAFGYPNLLIDELNKKK